MLYSKISRDQLLQTNFLNQPAAPGDCGGDVICCCGGRVSLAVWLAPASRSSSCGRETSAGSSSMPSGEGRMATCLPLPLPLSSGWAPSTSSASPPPSLILTSPSSSPSATTLPLLLPLLLPSPLPDQLPLPLPLPLPDQLPLSLPPSPSPSPRPTSLIVSSSTRKSLSSLSAQFCTSPSSLTRRLPSPSARRSLSSSRRSASSAAPTSRSCRTMAAWLPCSRAARVDSSVSSALPRLATRAARAWAICADCAALGRGRGGAGGLVVLGGGGWW